MRELQFQFSVASSAGAGGGGGGGMSLQDCMRIGSGLLTGFPNEEDDDMVRLAGNQPD